MREDVRRALAIDATSTMEDRTIDITLGQEVSGWREGSFEAGSAFSYARDHLVARNHLVGRGDGRETPGGGLAGP